jgi:excisionase family DNA binding protein
MLLTIKDVAQQLQIKPSTLYAWAAQGRIPCVKLHGLVRFRRDEIESWVESFRVDPTTPQMRRAMPSRDSSNELEALIAHAKVQAYNSRPRGTQTRSSPIGKEKTDGAV